MGARLTFNSARKGGFSFGGEDYRWKVIREKLGPIQFQILNFTFVAFGQVLIIWLFTSPVHQAWTGRHQSLHSLDGMAVALFLVFWILEAFNDQHMWSLQQGRKRRIDAGEPATEPIVTSRFFGYCRHPSDTCEMGMWIVFYFLGAAATGQWIHWSGLGFILLVLVFFGSIHLGESISLKRYPSYRDYQVSTPRFIPFTRLGCIERDS
jgi:steroid 5-alpha reductase family enzyme